jgi:vacuolar-type H+-ATPase subunit I/STV1
MQYKEMNYTQKQEFEKSLTIGQRAKMRRLEKEFKAQIQPINWASHAREEEVRREAWKSLKVGERVDALEAAHSPKINSLREQIAALQEELDKTREELSEERSKIQSEPWQVAGNDPEVKAMNAIWRKTKEVQEIKFQQLVDSFAEKVSN